MRKAKRKKYVPFMERLTPEQREQFRIGMDALRRKFKRRLKCRPNKAVKLRLRKEHFGGPKVTTPQSEPQLRSLHRERINAVP